MATKIERKTLWEIVNIERSTENFICILYIHMYIRTSYYNSIDMCIVSGKSAFLLEIEKRRKEATINSKSDTNVVIKRESTKSVENNTENGVFAYCYIIYPPPRLLFRALQDVA